MTCVSSAVDVIPLYFLDDIAEINGGMALLPQKNASLRFHKPSGISMAARWVTGGSQVRIYVAHLANISLGFCVVDDEAYISHSSDAAMDILGDRLSHGTMVIVFATPMVYRVRCGSVNRRKSAGCPIAMLSSEIMNIAEYDVVHLQLNAKNEILSLGSRLDVRATDKSRDLFRLAHQVVGRISSG